ncbi:MAG: class I SAM-dependent methyltransferase, partial [Oscillochloris sp.]|nr:class I SAM-dependent methyltransferase [Oscillochloris sp.]
MYESYAPIYDAIGQGAFAEELTQHILAATSTLPHRALDLACGTGAATLIMAEAGVHVIGVDRSQAMLRIARARARDRNLPVRWVAADIRRLSRSPAARSALRPDSFDLITCLYDSLNYLTGADDLAAVCEGVARLLRTGGRFIFDLNTVYEFATWDDTDQVVFDSPDILVYNQLYYDADQRLARGRIVWFVREVDRWWRGEEMHEERAWEDAEVVAALEGAGLTLVARYTPQWKPAAAD